MIDSEATKEITILDTLKKQRRPLVERMDRTFGYFRGDKFTIPDEEGVWENVTSNRAQSDGWKIINSLAASQRSIFNEAKKEDAADREKLNYNELLVSGLLFSAERLRDGLPESPFLQAEMAFHRVIRGWGAYRLLVMEDDDSNPYLDLAIWDPRNVNYISGKTGLLKVYYERSVMKDQALDEFPGFNGKVDNNGIVKIINIWDCMVHREKGQPVTEKITKEAVIAGGEYVKKPEDVKVGGTTIDWLPIRIKAGGSVPLVMENDTQNTADGQENIRKVGEDYLVNIRDLLDDESRLMTYHLDAAGKEAGQPTVLEWDSSKGEFPKEWDENMKDPRGKKNVVTIDVGKGQKVADLVPQATGGRVEIARGMLDAKLSIGSLHPIAFGVGGAGETAFGVDIRNHNTREHISPFRLAMEQDYVWIATESVKQYKAGSFKTSVEFSGYDSKGKWFSEKIDESKIEEGKIFKCTLIADELRDRAAHSTMAIAEKGAGLLPLREILDIHQLSDDPDASIDAIFQELADQMFDAPAVKGFLAKIKDYAKSKDPEKRFELDHAYRKLVMLKLMENQQLLQAAGGGGQGGGNVAATRSRVTARKAQPNAPTGGGR